VQELLPFEEPVPTPAFDELVKELDRLLDQGFLQEPEPALEDLFLARHLGAAEQRA
jgi:hypothetical protein